MSELPSTLRDKGIRLFARGEHQAALAVLAEAVRRSPSDHRSRMLASRSLAELGERERAVTALHTAAEGLLGRDYLLSAIAACKMALRINPVEKRVRETLRRIHARAEANAHSKAAGPPRSRSSRCTKQGRRETSPS